VRYAGEHNTSEEALIYFRQDGTVEKADARGHVNMQNDQGRQLHASAVEVLMDARGNTQQATLDGGLLFSAAEGHTPSTATQILASCSSVRMES